VGRRQHRRERRRVDIAPAALNAARTRAAAMGIEDRAEFREGSFEGTDSIPERSTAS